MAQKRENWGRESRIARDGCQMYKQEDGENQSTPEETTLMGVEENDPSR